MITFLTYQLKVAVIMAVFYIFYRLFLIKDSWHRLNRIVLLSTALLSFLLPVCIITITKTEILPLPVEQLMQAASSTPAEVATPWWHIALMAAYAVGVIFVLARVLASVLRVRSIIRHARKEVTADGTVVYVMPGNDPSFSWMGHIVISEADWSNGESAIIRHEKAHVALRHSIDVLITDIIAALQWFNPAIWMLRIDLRAVHEYEADDTVLRSGTDLRSYQYLLISKAAAMNGYTIANNFNHSILKNRIFMMEKERTTRRSLLRALYLLPLVCISLALNAQTKVIYVNGNAQSGQTPQKVVGKATLTYDTLKYDVTINYDLIKSLPGAEIDEDGNITINGKPVSKVLINGEQYYPNQDVKDIPDHTVHINSSKSLPGYVSYSDTIVEALPNGATTTRVSSGMFRPDATNLNGRININVVPFDNVTVEDMLRSMPGVEVQDDGTYTVNGKAVSRILVNGEELKQEKDAANSSSTISITTAIKSIDENGNITIDTQNGTTINLNGTQVTK